jgi:hypothetical protein
VEEWLRRSDLRGHRHARPYESASSKAA